MENKNKVLSLLEQNKDHYVSGQRISEVVNISRNAVWKIINNLKKEGYMIESKTNAGYKLAQENDILSAEGIQNNLSSKYQGAKIYVYEQIDSTNNQAKKLAASEDGILIVTANEQTSGRGRRGRSFSSPSEGIYMSLVLKPDIKIDEIYFMTILTVVAVHRVLTRLTGQKIDIKWVNDLYLNGKKICGILTELVSDMETMEVSHVVAGIGINVNNGLESHPKDLKDKIGILEIGSTDRNRIIGEIASELIAITESYEKQAIIDEYKTFQMLFGKEVQYTQNEEVKTALVKDINLDGGLVVIENGVEKILNSGEVSVIPKNI